MQFAFGVGLDNVDEAYPGLPVLVWVILTFILHSCVCIGLDSPVTQVCAVELHHGPCSQHRLPMTVPHAGNTQHPLQH